MAETRREVREQPSSSTSIGVDEIVGQRVAFPRAELVAERFELLFAHLVVGVAAPERGPERVRGAIELVVFAARAFVEAAAVAARSHDVRECLTADSEMACERRGAGELLERERGGRPQLHLRAQRAHRPVGGSEKPRDIVVDLLGKPRFRVELGERPP
jgi:hypothetical protein